ncbi:MAG TPA: fused response regulator/phosphatase [Acidimicrobiales bacterium]
MTGDGRATVLVVDDVAAHRAVVGAWLRQAGYEVVEAATGAAALDAVESRRVDLVTLDVILPDMSGMEVCERIKGAERTAALPILHLSGTAVAPADRNEGLRRGADAYLVEPVESDELLATVNALLRYSAARRRAVRLAGYLRRLHTVNLAISAATTAEVLVAAVADGLAAIFEAPAAAALTVGRRSLVGAAAPGRGAVPVPCEPTRPLDVAAAVTANQLGADLFAEVLADVLPDGAAVPGARAGAGAGVDDTSGDQPGTAGGPAGATVVDRAGAVLGAVLVARSGVPDEERDEVEVLLDQLAHAVAIAAENLRAYQLEQRISLTLQRSLLPTRASTPAGVDVAFRYEAAADHTEVGGDFYELFELDGDRVLAAVGDVVGHSLQAAIVMAQLRNGLRAYALEGHEPAAILERLDKLLRRFHPTITATVCLALIDRRQRRVTVANAGHIAPLHLGSHGVAFVEPHGPLLGMGFRAPPPVTVDLGPGDTLLFVTDGLLERRDEIIDTGLDRLVEVATRWRGDLDDLCDRLLRDVGPGEAAADDIALLALRLAPNGEADHAGAAGAVAGDAVSVTR